MGDSKPWHLVRIRLTFFMPLQSADLAVAVVEVLVQHIPVNPCGHSIPYAPSIHGMCSQLVCVGTISVTSLMAALEPNQKSLVDAFDRLPPPG
jgi:hypothetical protein